MKSFASETLPDRIVRLLGAALRDPAKTRETLERLHKAEETRTLQPFNAASSSTVGQLHQATMFDDYQPCAPILETNRAGF